MLAQSHRFHGLGSLNFAYKSGRVVRSDSLALRHAPNNRRSTYRAAVVVSKKVAKSAVQRNRIRRKIFEAVRVCEIPKTCNQDLIFLIYDAKIAEQSAAELRQQIHVQLRRAGVL